MKTYQEMWVMFQKGYITTQEWVEYCEKLLFQKMVENRDVFVRLKNR